MKVLIADSFEQEGLDALNNAGCVVLSDPDLKGEALTAAVASSGCRVLIVRSTKVPAATIESGTDLGLIVRAGAGYDNIDLGAASGRSVYVANCPGKNAAAVAELTLGLILALDRRIPDNVVDLRNKTWAKKTYSAARGLKGRTLGILGTGTIGKEVIRRARAFDMHVIAWSRSLTPETAGRLKVEFAASPEEVATHCDILSVHLASASETAGLVGSAVFERLRPGSYFINTARADIVDYDALRHAIAEKEIRAGLDVFPSEPGAGDTTFENDLIDTAGVIYGTHHIGASTDEAQLAVAAEAVQIVRTYMHSGDVRNCVNMCTDAAARGVLVVRHRNRPGVLASVLGVLSHCGINVREMQNVIYQGEEGACARIRLDSQPDSSVLSRIAEADDNVFSVVLAS